MSRPLTWIVWCLGALLFTSLAAWAAAQPATGAPLSEFDLIQAAYAVAEDTAYYVAVRAYPDPDRDLAKVKTFAFDRFGQQNYLLAKDLLHQLTGLLTARGYKVVEENPDALITLDFFIGRRDQYTPPNTLQAGLTGQSWPIGPALVVPGQGVPPYFRVIRVYLLDYSALKSGQELPQPPLMWAAEATSEGGTGDLREVAPVMLMQLLGEFPRPSAHAMSRSIFRYNYSVIGVTFDPGTLVIREVRAGSPAEQAGLQPGDAIVRANDKSLPARFAVDWKKKADLSRRLEPWLNAVTWTRGKDPVRLTVKRPGVKGELTVTVTPESVTTYVTQNR